MRGDDETLEIYDGSLIDPMSNDLYKFDLE